MSRSLSPTIKLLEREVDHVTPSTADLKNALIYIAFPYMSL
jgi:hypothetical protein